jgi:hypothetical protein
LFDTSALDRSEALATFGKELGLNLVLFDSDAVVASYLLDEWEVGPHSVNHTVPIFATPL